MKGMQLLFSLVASALLTLDGVCAFSFTSASRYGTPLDSSTKASVLSSPANQAKENDGEKEQFNCRRKFLQNAAFVGLSALVAGTTANPSPSWAEENIYAPKFVQEYEDFKQNPEGFSVRDVTVGKGESPQVGDRIVYEWSGYSKSTVLFNFLVWYTWFFVHYAFLTLHPHILFCYSYRLFW